MVHEAPPARALSPPTYNARTHAAITGSRLGRLLRNQQKRTAWPRPGRRHNRASVEKRNVAGMKKVVHRRASVVGGARAWMSCEHGAGRGARVWALAGDVRSAIGGVGYVCGCFHFGGLWGFGLIWVDLGWVGCRGARGRRFRRPRRRGARAAGSAASRARAAGGRACARPTKKHTQHPIPKNTEERSSHGAT